METGDRAVRVVAPRRRRDRLRRRPGRQRRRILRPQRPPALELLHRRPDQGFGVARLREDLHRQLRRHDARPLGSHRPARLAQHRLRQLLLDRRRRRRARVRRVARRPRLRILRAHRGAPLELRHRELRLRLARRLARPRRDGSYDHAFYAIDGATGSLRWRYRARAAISGAASVIDGIAYFSSFDHRTYALSAANGRLHAEWQDGEYSPAVAGDGRLYLVGLGRIYALAARR